MKSGLVVHLDTPFLPCSEYAKRTGQTAGQVRDLCGRGLLPAKKIGKCWYVNVAKLTEMALNEEAPKWT